MSYYYNDPSGRGSWVVYDERGETPETAQANPANPIWGMNFNIGSGVGQGTSSAPSTQYTGGTSMAFATPQAFRFDSEDEGETPTIPTDTGAGSEGGFRMRLRGPDGTYKFTRDIGEIDKLLGQGWKPIGDDGRTLNVESFNGGTLIDGLPLNTVLTGTITDEQRRAMINGGRGSAVDGIPLTQSTPGSPQQGPANFGQAGYFGNQGAQAPGLPDDFQDMLRQLIQESRDQGKRGEERLTGITDDYKNFLGFARSAAEQTFGRRDELVNAMLGKVTPGIESAISGMNDAPGLSPEGMAALRQRATEGPERDYQAQVQNLKTQLAQRGAYGGGDLPGSLS
jgi:hypothetical protein